MSCSAIMYNIPMTNEQLYINASKGLKAALKSSNWWPIIQDEIKNQLDYILNNFELLGPHFRDAFVALFKYEHQKRMVQGIMDKTSKPSALFGKTMSNECYECGKMPTKVVLGLYEWTDPNEADVQACISLCNQLDQVDALKTMSPDLFGKISSTDDFNIV